MSIVTAISTVSRNVSCFWLIHMYSRYKETPLLALEILYWELIFLGWGAGGRLMGSGNTNEKVGLRVIVEKLKICS